MLRELRSVGRPFPALPSRGVKRRPGLPAAVWCTLDRSAERPGRFRSTRRPPGDRWQRPSHPSGNCWCRGRSHLAGYRRDTRQPADRLHHRLPASLRCNTRHAADPRLLLPGRGAEEAEEAVVHDAAGLVDSHPASFDLFFCGAAEGQGGIQQPVGGRVASKSPLSWPREMMPASSRHDRDVPARCLLPR